MKIIKKQFLMVLACAMLFTAMPMQTGIFSPEVVQAAVTISKTSVKIYQGESMTLKVNGTSKKPSWSTNNKAVATVDSNGKVKAIKKGTAKITAKVYGKSYTCTVKVIGKTKVNKCKYGQVIEYRNGDGTSRYKIIANKKSKFGAYTYTINYLPQGMNIDPSEENILSLYSPYDPKDPRMYIIGCAYYPKDGVITAFTDQEYKDVVSEDTLEAAGTTKEKSLKFKRNTSGNYNKIYMRYPYFGGYEITSWIQKKNSTDIMALCVQIDFGSEKEGQTLEKIIESVEIK